MSDPDNPWSPEPGWWVGEVSNDATYRVDIPDILADLIDGGGGRAVVDLGCGDGHLSEMLASMSDLVVGIDLDLELLALASDRVPVARIGLPEVEPLRTGAFDIAVAVLVVEHIADHAAFFRSCHRVVTAGGHLVVVANHPHFTAPGSAPIQDVDGEVLWRPGSYFQPGFTDEAAGVGVVRFHHRTMADLLTTAAAEGWGLDVIREFGPLPSQLAETPALSSQLHIPRLVALRWRRS